MHDKTFVRHYGAPPCRDDEIEGTGSDGVSQMCLTVCDSRHPDGACPTDVAKGVTATPLCSDMGWCGPNIFFFHPTKAFRKIEKRV